MSSNETLISRVLRYENLSSSAIAKVTKLSQPTVSRALSKMLVLKLGGGRSTVFALLETQECFPLFQVNEAGRITQLGHLYRLTENRTVLVQENGFQSYEGLPFYLYDALPAGFLGVLALKNIIKKDQALTSKSQDWSDSQIMHYLIGYGEDIAGNLILSEPMAANVAQRQYKVLNRNHYAHITSQINNFPEGLGSSIAGEQPKFTIFNGQQHLIVKYSPLIKENNPVATRHRDLMVCEHLALNTLSDHGVAASESELYIGDRFYLELKRFDRIGTHGRRGLASLKVIDAEYVGKNQDWTVIAKSLLSDQLISQNDFMMVEISYAFGSYIANTDMHNGNCSFFMKGLVLDGITPVYDMLPMAFMPVQGELGNPAIEMPRFIYVSDSANQKALKMAIDYWGRVMDHEYISNDFKLLAQKLLDELNQIAV